MSDITDFLTQNSSNFGDLVKGFGTGVQGLGFLQHGQMSYEASQYAAEQARQGAASVAGSGQRQAWDIGLTGKYIASKALATAAGTGGGASDPTVMNLIGRMSGETAYRQSVAIYGGESRARAMNITAAGEQWSGAEALQMGQKSALAAGVASLPTVLRGGISLYDKYKGPNTPFDTNWDQ